MKKSFKQKSSIMCVIHVHTVAKFGKFAAKLINFLILLYVGSLFFQNYTYSVSFCIKLCNMNPQFHSQIESF